MERLWGGLQQVVAGSRLAGCSIEDGTCFLFFNDNPLGQPICLAFQAVLEVSLWLWQAETSAQRVWGELANGQDSSLPILGCRINQPEVWPTAQKRARQVEIVYGSAQHQRVGPQILLHLQPAMLAVHASQLAVCTRAGTLSLQQVAALLRQQGQKLVEQHRYQEALDTCQAVTKVWQGAADLHMTLGHCYLGLREWNSAIGEFSEVIRLKPDCGEAYFGLGEAHDGARKPSRQYYAQAALQLAKEGKADRASEAQRRAQAST